MTEREQSRERTPGKAPRTERNAESRGEDRSVHGEEVADKCHRNLKRKIPNLRGYRLHVQT